MTSLADALAKAGISPPASAPSTPAVESGVIDVSSMAGVDTTTMQTEDAGEIPEFLKRVGPETVVQPPAMSDPALAPPVPTSPFGGTLAAPPVVVNTVVPPPVPVTPEVTPAAPTSGGEGSNQPVNPAADRRAVLRTITTLGENEGLGANARAGFFEKVADAARMGALTEDDAEIVQTKYNEGVAKAKGIGTVKMPSETQQRSKIKAMIKLGALPGIRADLLLANVRDRINEARSAGQAPKKSPADIYLTVARMQLGQPQHILTDGQIDQAMASKTPDQKMVADLLYALASAADKLLAEDANTPLDDDSAKLVQDMLAPLVQRVQDLGGTTAMQKEQKKIEERQKKDAEKAASLANKVPKLRNLGSYNSLPGGAAWSRG
jgi:hypothetical protein